MNQSLNGVWSLSFATENQGPIIEDMFQYNSNTESINKSFDRDIMKEIINNLHWNNEISIPSTTEIARIPSSINELEKATTMYLGRPYKVHGKVWYKTLIDIPVEMQGHQVQLYIQRSKYSNIFIDGVHVSGSFETVVPQVHNLGQLTVGEHELVVCVDNELEKYSNFSVSLYRGHQYTDHTQTNWNGMLGCVELRYYKDIYISKGMIIDQNEVKHCKLELGGCALLDDSWCNMNQLYHCIHLNVFDKENQLIYKIESKLTQEHLKEQKVELKIPNHILAEWDEFNPNYYKVEAYLTINGKVSCHSYETHTGIRKLTTSDYEIRLNDNRIHLRGSLDCAIYPLTGACPFTIEEWRIILLTMKEYGLNHYRFHSWCPPKEAFMAADEIGMYLQVELSNFANGFYSEQEEGYDKALNDYLYDQSRKLLLEYGNHPSFIIYSIGNEMIGNMNEFNKLLSYLKTVRHDLLLNQGANNFLEDPIQCQEDDVWIMMRTTKEDNIRASFSHNDPPLGYMQRMDRQGTIMNYNKEVSVSNVPVISHEIGQFQSSPRVSDKKLYTGALRGDSFEIIEQRLKDKKLLEYNLEDYKNSGQLLLACYKEEIEAALRTDCMSGFQLLGLQDFSGQGTALVGVLDSLMKNKEFITSKNFRKFNNHTVVLAKFPSYSYEISEQIPLEIELYNYSGVSMSSTLNISIYKDFASYDQDIVYDETKRIYHTSMNDCIGDDRSLTSLTKLNINLKDISFDIMNGQGKEYTLVVEYNGYENSYPLYLFYIDKDCNEVISMNKEELEEPYQVYEDLKEISHELREEISRGKKVLVLSSHMNDSIEGFFTTDFWCYPMFKEACIMTNKDIAPGTLGLSIDKDHEALTGFPTNSYSNWQWHPITMNSRPIILDNEILDHKGNIHMIVRAIDNFDRNHHLGLVYEETIGEGTLVVCASNLRNHLEQLECRCLYESLVRYMEAL